jgi:hypothetical protein
MGYQRRASGGRLVLLGLQTETFQRAHDRPDGVGGNAHVERRRFQFRMSEQDLNHPGGRHRSAKSEAWAWEALPRPARRGSLQASRGG